MSNYPKGSMGAADQKTVNIFRIAMALVTVIAIILLWTVPLLKVEAKQTGGFFKAISWIAFIICFGSVAFNEKITDKLNSETAFYVIWFFSLAAAFFFRICGGI